MNCLEPLMTHSSPSRTPRGLSEARAEAGRRRPEREAQVGDAGSASAGRLLVEHDRLLRRHPATAPLLGPSRRSPALLAHLEAVLLAHLLVLEALLLGGAGPWLCSGQLRHVRLQPGAHLVAEGFLLFRVGHVDLKVHVAPFAMPFWGWSYDAALWANFTPPSSYRTNTEGTVPSITPTSLNRFLPLS